MPIGHKLRIKDKRDSFYEGRQDFLVRRFGFSSLQVIQFLTVTLLIITATTFFLYRVYRDMAGLSYDSSDHTWLLSGCLTAVVVGFVLHVSTRQIKAHKDAIDATEFLNALFASALGNAHVFCMIVTQSEGHVFYVDKGFQGMFPDIVSSDELTLDALLSRYSTSGQDYNALQHAIKAGISGQFTLKINGGSEKKMQNITLAVESIERPSGFCLVRGKPA